MIGAISLVLGAILTAPQMLPGLAVSDDDYPPQALRAEQSGTVGYRVTVQTNGVPANCEIITSSTFPVLDERTCQIVLHRARFVPATDAAGNPAPAPYAGKIKWHIPNPGEGYQDMAQLTAFIGPAGTIQSCAVRRGSNAGPVKLDCGSLATIDLATILGRPLGAVQLAFISVRAQLSDRDLPTTMTNDSNGMHTVLFARRFAVNDAGRVGDCLAPAAGTVVAFDACSLLARADPPPFPVGEAGTTRSGAIAAVFGMIARVQPGLAPPTIAPPRP